MTVPESDHRASLLAVLIDADNVPASYAEAIFEEIASIGEASIRRIYGDFSTDFLRGWAKKMPSLAIVPHQNFASTKGKNASDIALVIDAMDILHTGRFDGFVLVSSDSDFTRLASRIREQGVDVYGIGEKKTPEAFRMACKRFLYVENLVSPETPAKTQTKPVKRQNLSELENLVERAMDAINQDDEWYSLGQLGQFMVTANPDFDTRTYGRKKLSDLIGELPNFEMRKGAGNQFEVRKTDD